MIIEEADRLRNLVDRMLGSNKLPQLAPVNIHEVLARVCSLVEAESQGRLSLVRDYDPSIPELLADSEQLIQAVLNIVRNAMQALAARKRARGAGAASVLRTRALRQFTIGHQRHRLVLPGGGHRQRPGHRRRSCRTPSSTPWSAAVPTAPAWAWPSPRTSSTSIRA